MPSVPPSKAPSVRTSPKAPSTAPSVRAGGSKASVRAGGRKASSPSYRDGWLINPDATSRDSDLFGSSVRRGGRK